MFFIQIMTKVAFKIKNKFYLGTLACLFGSFIAKGDLLSDGRTAFMNYDFERASELYEKYEKTLKKNTNPENEELLEQYMRQLEIAENSLDNVQKIEIIDRIDVPVSEYFKYIKLPSSAGKIMNSGSEMLKNRRNMSDFAYSSEAGDIMMWSENSDEHQEVIMESDRLMDGTWDNPVNVGSVLNEGGNVRNPFLLTDGLTLYFSGDGEGSMGGYDLFVASKDPVSGQFRQPTPLGYPFNSPYNEYMMAIDEDNGIGWWVTDRNRLDGQVSIYIFKTNDVRKNYVADEEEDIVSLARIDDITVTQNPNTDYACILKDIDTRFRQNKDSGGNEFIFPMPGGRVATKLSDFSSSAAKRSMQQYLQALNEHNALEQNLSDLRKRYHQTDRKMSSSIALKNQILDLEKQRDWQSERLKKMRNTVISAETKE